MRVEKPIAIKMHVVVETVKTIAVKGEGTVGAKVEMCRTASGLCFYVLYYYTSVLFSCIKSAIAIPQNQHPPHRIK